MKKILCLFALVLAAMPRLGATQYTFENFDVSIAGAGPLSLQLGGFAAGFDPTGANTADWLSHWVTGDTGYYDETGPEWSANLALADNAGLAVGQQLFLWAFDTQAGVGSSWALFSDSSWLMSTNDGLDPTTYFLGFTADTQASFGGLNFAQGVATLAVVGGAGSSVPDASTSAPLLALGCALAVGLRRRFQIPSA